jgi:Protein of unknown function (DUF1501)
MQSIKTAVPTLARREFLRVGAAVLSCYDLLPMIRPSKVEAASELKLRGSAEYCIFLFLNGGASHIDTFDLKEGPWTPQDFDIRTVRGGPLKLPYALYPMLADRADDLAVVRSMEAWETAHGRAQYYMQVAHPVSPARRNEMPSVGAVVAYEMEARRKPSHFLPPFVAMNYGAGAGVVGSGCLPPKLNPLSFDTRTDLDFVLPDAERQRFDRRWSLLQQMEREGATPAISAAGPAEAFQAHHERAHAMMLAPGIGQILQVRPEDHKRYGGSAFGDACVLARNLIAAEAGTRYIFISQGSWDAHTDIYDKTKPDNIYLHSRDLDEGVGNLLLDLSERKTSDGAKLLDKTLIVCTGEFGRTVGPVTLNLGRDHYRYAFTGLFAGGGVRGGRVIGATDATGAKVVEAGWSKKRSIYPEDIAATIYSALGIDYSKKITNTPSGRAFEYLEAFSGTTFMKPAEIDTLFT